MATIALACSCVAPSGNDIKVGMHRSDLSQWETRSCETAGITVDIPVDAYQVREQSDSVFVQLHPVYLPAHVLVEPQVTITVSFDRSSRAAQDAMGAGVLKYKTNAADRAYWTWEYAMHTNTATRVAENWSIYRRDYPQDSDTLWVGRAELLRIRDGDRYPFLEEDDSAVRRILDSFRPDGGHRGHVSTINNMDLWASGQPFTIHFTDNDDSE